jgi:uncharacterized LabA/DUF88 family protein
MFENERIQYQEELAEGDTMVFVDGGYFAKGKNLGPRGKVPIDLNRMAHVLSFPGMVRSVFFYDCLPPLPKDGDVEAQHRYNSKRNFLDKLGSLPRVRVRYGVMQSNELTLWKERQRGVDVMLGVDMALAARSRAAKVFTLVSGDIDLLPVVKMVQDEGIWVRLGYFGFDTVSSKLFEQCDETVDLLSEPILSQILLWQKKEKEMGFMS